MSVMNRKFQTSQIQSPSTPKRPLCLFLRRCNAIQNGGCLAPKFPTPCWLAGPYSYYAHDLKLKPTESYGRRTSRIEAASNHASPTRHASSHTSSTWSDGNCTSNS